MSPLNAYFDRIYVINLDRRPDRWSECVVQFAMFGIEAIHVPATDGLVDESGRYNGNLNCTTSHRRVLDRIIEEGVSRALVLEDDFEITTGTFNEQFAALIPELPVWSMLYLGGHYAEPPINRHSPHVIRCGRMLTTSSYGITLEMAKIMAPSIHGVGPIDTLYGAFHREYPCFITDPRLMIQRPSYSDLQERDMNNSFAMLDDNLSKLV